MDLRAAQNRFRFLAHAFNGTGGFRPVVAWEDQQVKVKAQDGSETTAIRRVPKISSPSYLVPYQRESAERYAARNAVATYENHLREACERFVGYLGRKQPMRDGLDGPLTQLFLGDCNLQGAPLNEFLVSLALETKARGTMLVVIDIPAGDAPSSLAEQIERRRVPYVRALAPEHVVDCQINDETGLFDTLSIGCVEVVGGQRKQCVRTWDAHGWQIKCGEQIVAQGEHPFGVCPVLAVTETGAPFPVVGKFEQIADMSLRLFNARSELDELLRGQTFSVLTMQVPEGSDVTQWMGTAATIGVHSMLVHPGVTPAFIAPDSANAETYLACIESLQQSIKRVAMDEATTEGGAAESGVARRLRFERLNADLASFARRMQSLERRIWTLFARGIGVVNRVTVEWPSDFNLVDTLAELDVLTGMQAGGFPPQALALKRKTIAAAEFDAADEADKRAVLDAIDEQAQEPPEAEPDPNADPAKKPNPTSGA